MKKIACLSVLLAATLLPSFALANYYQTISRTTEIIDDLGLARVETVIQAGNDELNRFTMHRVVKVDEDNNILPPCQLKGAFVLLPGGASGFEMYEAGHDEDSTAYYLAMRGIDVYGYSSRARGLELGYCSENDCSQMENWGMRTYARDISYIRWIATMRHFKRPAVGGVSLGTMLTVASISRNPFAWAGAVLWDGTLYYASPLADQYTDVCTQLKTQVKEGIYYDDQTYPGFKYMHMLATMDPDGDSPFAPGFTNEQFLIYVFTTPSDPPQGEAPGYTYAAGDLINGFTYVDDELLADIVYQFNDYEPTALVRDYVCGFSGEREFSRWLGFYTEPVLMLGAGMGFGPYMQDNLDLLGTSEADITQYLYTERGHGDMLGSTDMTDIVNAPMYQWLEQNIFPQWGL